LASQPSGHTATQLASRLARQLGQQAPQPASRRPPTETWWAGLCSWVAFQMAEGFAAGWPHSLSVARGPAGWQGGWVASLLWLAGWDCGWLVALVCPLVGGTLQRTRATTTVPVLNAFYPSKMLVIRMLLDMFFIIV